ncbi:MAG: calcium/sodium antiporter [Planctomycetes bacterium]|nr:calcium/sodium antiporter [Planctomycetota bacterium]
MNDWIQLVGGGLLLYFGAEWFVGGASALALALRVPQILVGLTVVAYGTSAPEIIVGVQAASAGHGDVALGNVIGSNISNIGLILGIAALIRPARVDGALRRRELPVLVVSTAVVPLLLLDGVLSRWEAGGLVVVAIGYTGWMIRAAHSASSVATARVDATRAGEAADAAGAPKTAGVPRAALTAAAGLAVLLVGGHIFVNGSVSVAHALGMSDRLVGLTIVAVGTSLPELVTSVIAARRGHSDLAVGNVVGSNIFNTLLCLGAAGIAGSVGAPLQTLGVELVALVVMTGVAAAFIRSERTISRLEGGLAVALYAVFTALTVARG